MPARTTTLLAEKWCCTHFCYFDQTNLMVVLMIPLASYDADDGASSITWPEKSSCISFDHLDVRNRMVPLITLLESCNTDTRTYGITCPQYCVAHCFSHLDLMNAVELLIMPLALHDTDVSASSVTGVKKSCYYTSFQPVWLNKCNTGFSWAKMSSWASFQLSQTNNQNGAIDSAISVMCCIQTFIYMNMSVKIQVSTCMEYMCMHLLTYMYIHSYMHGHTDIHFCKHISSCIEHLCMHVLIHTYMVFLQTYMISVFFKLQFSTFPEFQCL